MGLSCKPMGKMKSIMRKLENKQEIEAKEVKKGKAKSDKEN